jgi:uncharacterized UPF0160 family protein
MFVADPKLALFYSKGVPTTRSIPALENFFSSVYLCPVTTPMNLKSDEADDWLIRFQEISQAIERPLADGPISSMIRRIRERWNLKPMSRDRLEFYLRNEMRLDWRGILCPPNSPLDPF